MCLFHSVPGMQPTAGAQEVLGVGHGALGQWMNELRAGSALGGWWAGCISALALPISQYSHHSSLSPDIWRLEALIMQDRTIACFAQDFSISELKYRCILLLLSQP